MKLLPTKVCKFCAEEKSINLFEFTRDPKSYRDHYRNECMRCKSARRGKSELNKIRQQCYKHDINDLQYIQMEFDQDYRCAICNIHKKDIDNDVLCIDHDHKTGKVRGLLCRKCNSGIGMLKDDPSTLRKAAEYLESFT